MERWWDVEVFGDETKKNAGTVKRIGNPWSLQDGRVEVPDIFRW